MSHIFGPRGFVTIATGDIRYYKIARNLLISYRRFASKGYPFAIICDRETELIKEFDHHIIIDDPSNNYMDKLKLFRELPFEETIFIDADCLAYGNLDEWWDLFHEADDFSLFGFAYSDLSCGKGWFSPDGMGKYRDEISFIPSFNGGVYYLRNTAKCEKVFEIANECARHYSDYHFRGFIKPADEPVLALAMAVLDCKPINRHELVFAPKLRKLDADIVIPQCSYEFFPGKWENTRLIHWSNYLTKKSFYRFEAEKLNKRIRWDEISFFDLILYKFRLRRLVLRIYDLTAFAFRIKRKLKKWLERHDSK